MKKQSNIKKSSGHSGKFAVSGRLKGFTLIEVLIVVAIVGLLASVVLVGLGGFRSRGRDTRRIADLKQVQNGLELYYAKYSEYPNAANWTNLESALKDALIGVSKLPNDPQPGKTYTYAQGQEGQSYVLKAELEEVNPANNEVNGRVFGVDCDSEKNYCVQF